MVERLDDFEEVTLDEDMMKGINEACTEDYPKFELKCLAHEPGSQFTSVYAVAKRKRDIGSNNDS